MTDRVIPLTPAGPLWSQREYVAASRLGIGFAAHRFGDLRQAFHYGFPDDIGCTTVIVDVHGPRQFIDHEFMRGADWIAKCAAATAAAAGGAR